ncbi:MAG: hypothetical protein AAFN92_03980, partial [Bacteroidota bacterium]
MRTLLFLLLLGCAAYASWYYWQRYNDRPLQTRILLAPIEDITRVQISERPNEAAFELRRTDPGGNWVVNREHTQLRDQSPAIKALLKALSALKTDSIAHDFVAEDKQYALVVHSASYGAEKLHLALPPEGPALARLAATG